MVHSDQAGVGKTILRVSAIWSGWSPVLDGQGRYRLCGGPPPASGFTVCVMVARPRVELASRVMGPALPPGRDAQYQSPASPAEHAHGPVNSLRRCQRCAIGH